MLKRSALLFALVLALLLPGAMALAQQDSGTSTDQNPEASPTGSPTVNPNLQIIWPQPITEVHGVIDVVGTANIPDMAFYRLEAIALNSDLSIPENAAWIPLTTDLTAPVTGSVLAQVDTTKLPDGLYQLQLAAYTGSIDAPGGETVTTVGPVRVNNDTGGGTGMTPTPAPPSATPTPAPANQAPYITPAGGATAINIRACAVIDNNACPVTGYIRSGQTAPILGISSDGAGWYLVNAPGGLTGWVSATVVTAVGNTADIPIVTPPTPFPPPPPPPPPPPATATAVPPAAGYVVPTGIGIQGGGTPQCGQGFNLEVNVANVGGSPAGGGTVTLQDVHVDNGVVTFTGYGNYPALNPGQNYVVVIPATITAYQGSKHELRASNDGQTQKLRYTLGNGSCGGPPPQPTPTSTPQQAGNIYNFGPAQCTFALKTNVKYFDHPDGKRLGETSSGGYTAVQGQRVNGTRWYMIEINGQYVWIRDRDAVKLGKSCRVF